MRLRIKVDKQTTVTLSSKMVRWTRPSIRMWMRYFDKRLALVNWTMYDPWTAQEILPKMEDWPHDPYQRVSLDWSMFDV